MRILFISTSIPPHPDSQTIRNVFWLRSLLERGWEVTVLTPQAPGGDESLQRMLPAGITYVRCDRSRYDLLQDRLRRIVGIGKHLAWLHGVLVNLWAAPDYRYEWDKIAVTAATALPRPDVIISSAGSCTAHLAAGQLASRYSVPWIADYGDPWTLNPIWPANAPHIRYRNRLLEQDVLPKASGVVFTTIETAQAYQDWLGPRLPPWIHIPCGYSEQEFAADEPRGFSAQDSLTISYIGVAYRQSRNLTPLMRAVAHANQEAELKHRFALRICGPHSGWFERYARQLQLSQIQFRGRISYDDSLREILNSHLLVLIGNTGALQIPGKAYMYLASGRPILYLSQQARETDPTYRLLRTFQGIWYAENTAVSIRQKLREVSSCYTEASRQAKERQLTPTLAAYEWTRLGSCFAEFIAKQSGRAGHQSE